MVQVAITKDLENNSKIVIDNFSNNRVVLCKQLETRYLVTNSKTDRRSGGMNCGYTCMLPAAEGICPLIFLIFSPFASLKADRKCRRYEKVRIKKKV